MRCEDASESAFQVASKLLAGPLSNYITPAPRDELRLSLEIPFSSDGMEVIARIRKLDIARPPQSPPDFPHAGLVFDLDVGHRPDEGSAPTK